MYIMRQVTNTSQPFKLDHANVAYGSISQIPQNRTIETTAISFHKLQFRNRIMTGEETQNIINMLI